MIPIIILITLTIIIITTLIFTNEKWTNYQNQPYNNFASLNYNPEQVYYVRKEYRLPYRYPVGFLHDSPNQHISSVHAYDINS